MANILQAAKWLDEGKHVRRPGYDGNVAWDADRDRLIWDGGRGEDGEFSMDLHDLLAEDWEIAH